MPPSAPASVPAEIAEALAAVGLQARAARPITTLTSPLHTRAVYRVELVSGATIKARRLEDEATAGALRALRAGLPPAFVPVRAAAGRVLFEPWIEGTDLRGVAPDPAIVSAAGALLAALHTTPLAAGCATGAAQPTASWRRLGERALATIGRHDALAAGTLAGLGAALARSDPGTAAAGLVHTDFCGDNFVVDAHGALHVIDNERVSVGAFGYDLARTWVRWNLGDADWARFATAYAAHGGPAAAFAAPAFWRLVASLGTAALRLEFGLGTPVSSARLDRVVAELA